MSKRTPLFSRFSFRIFLCLLAATLGFSASLIRAGDLPRETTSFDRAWKFHLGEVVGGDQISFDDTAWRTLDIPHDWMIEGVPGADPATMDGPFDQNSPAGHDGGFMNAGIGWYRKTFKLPESDKEKHIVILFDGAYMDSQVWLNGKLLGNRPYGFSSFYYDLTPDANFGDKPNVIAVRLNVVQPCCRWYSGAGLYRNVWLITTDRVHIAQWGTYITTPKAAADGAEVRVRTQVHNDGAAAGDAVLTIHLLDPDGKEVGHGEATKAVAAQGDASFDQTISLATAKLWSCENPVLYHAVSEVRVRGILTDSTTTTFGIRTIAFTKDKGFFLNGQHVEIKGVCDHHDLGCIGSVALRRGFERQLQILKTMGCNALRTSHNPPDPQLLDLCDQMGFLVMDEAFDEWKISKKKFGYGRFFDQWSDPDLTTMIDRDRNHPSIILWSTGNEIREGRGGKVEGGPMSEQLVAICHREDPTRPATSACAKPSNVWKSGVAKPLDVYGINYSPSYYAKNSPVPEVAAAVKLDDYDGHLPMFGSETASQTDTRGEYGLKLDAQGDVQIDPKPNFQVSSYDNWHTAWASTAETDLLDVRNAPWLAGEFVWTGFDYIGEPTPYQWPSRSAYFGINDLCGFPKDRYYIYKSQWSAEPMVHIRPMSWTWPGFEGKTIPVHVFTNADSVELFLNGKSLGTKNYPADCAEQTMIVDNKDKTTSTVKSPGLRLAWEVPYAPGDLKAVAKKNGQVVATDEIHTAGAPASMTLIPDRSQIAADGQDLSFIKVTLLDKDGNVCPDADNEITFSINGSAAVLAGVDNGDPTNHESFQGPSHKAFHGLALAVLRSHYDSSGPVTLTASAAGIPSVTTTVHVGAP
jgi:beta-galactosidase